MYPGYSTLILFTPASTALRGFDSAAFCALIENYRMLIVKTCGGLGRPRTANGCLGWLGWPVLSLCGRPLHISWTIGRIVSLAGKSTVSRGGFVSPVTRSRRWARDCLTSTNLKITSSEWPIRNVRKDVQRYSKVFGWTPMTLTTLNSDRVRKGVRRCLEVFRSTSR